MRPLAACARLLRERGAGPGCPGLAAAPPHLHLASVPPLHLAPVLPVEEQGRAEQQDGHRGQGQDHQCGLHRLLQGRGLESGGPAGRTPISTGRAPGAPHSRATAIFTEKGPRDSGPRHVPPGRGPPAAQSPDLRGSRPQACTRLSGEAPAALTCPGKSGRLVGLREKRNMLMKWMRMLGAKVAPAAETRSHL